MWVFTDLFAVGKFGDDLFWDLFLPPTISLSYINSGPTSQQFTNDLVSPMEPALPIIAPKCKQQIERTDDCHPRKYFANAFVCRLYFALNNLTERGLQHVRAR